MKHLQSLFVVVFLGVSAGPLWAEGATPQSSLFTARPAPAVRVAACLPDGAACDKGGDCCSGNCAPQHHKCGR